MDTLIEAGSVERGQWLYTTEGAVLIDGVRVLAGLAYIGTSCGVCVVPAQRRLFVS